MINSSYHSHKPEVSLLPEDGDWLVGTCLRPSDAAPFIPGSLKTIIAALLFALSLEGTAAGTASLPPETFLDLEVGVMYGMGFNELSMTVRDFIALSPQDSVKYEPIAKGQWICRFHITDKLTRQSHEYSILLMEMPGGKQAIFSRLIFDQHEFNDSEKYTYAVTLARAHQVNKTATPPSVSNNAIPRSEPPTAEDAPASKLDTSQPRVLDNVPPQSEPRAAEDFPDVVEPTRPIGKDRSKSKAKVLSPSANRNQVSSWLKGSIFTVKSIDNINNNPALEVTDTDGANKILLEFDINRLLLRSPLKIDDSTRKNYESLSEDYQNQVLTNTLMPIATLRVNKDLVKHPLSITVKNEIFYSSLDEETLIFTIKKLFRAVNSGNFHLNQQINILSNTRH